MKQFYLAALLATATMGCNTGKSTKATQPQDTAINAAIDAVTVDGPLTGTISTEAYVTKLKRDADAIRKTLPGLKPEQAAAAYTAFRLSVDSAVAGISANEGSWLDTFVNYYDNDGNLNPPASVQKRIQLLATVDIEPRGIGEGYTELYTTPHFYVKLFKPYLPADYQEFVQLSADEDTVLFDGDAAIVIPWNEIGERVEHWDRFLQTYPSSQLLKTARNNYRNYLHAYVFGEENTRTSENGKLMEDVETDFKAFAARNASKPSGRIIAKLLAANEKNLDEVLEDARKEIDAIEAE